ncbi:hypothetical protein HPB51_012747 [Rhipicephalus microplus]|uniref:Uncharacterized protein n=1 Tax=Rhipicephalus microplus TaxID=6941 RepID=A0A9J6E944_RHIMP|nr:hypothetical protein HPB51_012747 [Rhipicephalus microplus]
MSAFADLFKLPCWPAATADDMSGIRTGSSYFTHNPLTRTFPQGTISQREDSGNTGSRAADTIGVECGAVRACVAEARESAAAYSAAVVGGDSNAELERRREAWGKATAPRFFVSRRGCVRALAVNSGPAGRTQGSPASSLTSGPVQVRAVRARSAGGRAPSLARVSPPPLLTLTARSPW